MPTARPTAGDWVLFFMCVGVWGSAYALVRVGLEHHASPWQIVAGRLWAAAIFLNAILYLRRTLGKAPKPTPGALPKVLAMGLLGAAAPFALYSWAQLSAPSGLVGLCAAVTPLLVAGLAPAFGAAERLDGPRWFGLALGFAGVAALMGPSAFGHGPASLWAQAAAVAGAVCYAANTLIARGGVQIPPLEAAAGWTLIGALIATPFAIAETAVTPTQPDATAWLAILALAIGPTGLASIAYFHLVRSAGPVFVTQTNYLMPLWALCLGAIAFDERIYANAWLAFGLIAAGLFAAQHSARPAAAEVDARKQFQPPRALNI
jgi:drug/metabolite transporter (DMT)-like permease